MAAPSLLSGQSARVYRPVISQIRTYNWPPWRLNFWIFVMTLASSTIIGIFSIFIQAQLQLDLPVPWYFTYYVTVGALVLLAIAGIFWLIHVRRLLPAIVMIGAFIIFVLWLVGLVVISIQFWGPNGSIQANCKAHVFSGDYPTGKSVETLAWLQQRNICQSWQVVFAMGLIGAVFLIWLMIMAYQVFVNS